MTEHEIIKSIIKLPNVVVEIDNVRIPCLMVSAQLSDERLKGLRMTLISTGPPRKKRRKNGTTNR